MKNEENAEVKLRIAEKKLKDIALVLKEEDKGIVNTPRLIERLYKVLPKE